MNKFFVFILLILLGCNSNELLVADTDVLEVEVKGKTSTFFGMGKEFAGNENCGHIFLNASTSAIKSKTDFRIEMDITTEGFINEIHFFDYSDNNRHYRTADFNASKTFFIENFEFDPSSKSLSFEYTGKLFDLYNTTNSTTLSGKVEIAELTSIDCSFQPRTMEAEINKKKFTEVVMVGKSNSAEAKWFAFSDDGIQISIVTSELLEEMDIGTYTFTKTDLINKVEVESFIGIDKATPFRLLEDTDWESYQCEGELTIEKHIVGSKPHTTGSFSLKAYKDNNLIYEVKGGKFSI